MTEPMNISGPEVKKDFTSEVQAIIPESIAIANSIGLDEAINMLLLLERKCRTNSDFNNLKEVCLHMVRLCREKSDWAKLNSTLTILNKRRAQSKVAITAIVHEAMSYIDSTPSKEVKMELIKTMMEICEAKIYVEAEGAKLHLMLAMLYEADGDIGAACDAIQDVHVETYGSLTKREKADYIIHQVRLNLARKDLVRTMIQSRKMNRKTLDEAGFEEVKVSFYSLMVEYHVLERDVWETSQCYFKIYDTSITKADPAATNSALESCVAFALLAPHNNHQSDFLHRLLLLKDVTENPVLSGALGQFTKLEIMSTPFSYQAELVSIPALHKGGEDTSAHFLTMLQTRVTQHNIRVVSGYYTRIRIPRLAVLLSLTPEETETKLSDMATSGDLQLRIDRPAGIVDFSQLKGADDILSAWASDVGRMLRLMETTCHLINRENMVHKL